MLWEETPVPPSFSAGWVARQVQLLRMVNAWQRLFVSYSRFCQQSLRRRMAWARLYRGPFPSGVARVFIQALLLRLEKQTVWWNVEKRTGYLRDLDDTWLLLVRMHRRRLLIARFVLALMRAQRRYLGAVWTRLAQVQRRSRRLRKAARLLIRLCQPRLRRVVFLLKYEDDFFS